MISLPGVPAEMEYLTQNVVIPYLRDRFQLSGTIKARVLHVAGVGESTIDDWIGDLMTNENPTVGLLAHPGQVDVRITAKADSMEEADRLIAEMETQVRERIQEGLYGVDEQSLEETIMQALRDRDLKAVLVEMRRIWRATRPDGARSLPRRICAGPGRILHPEELRRHVTLFQKERGANVALGVSLVPGNEKHILHLSVSSPQGQEEYTRSFGGERALSNPWSVNTGLEMLRRKIET